MDNTPNPQQALIAKLKESKNILVTVRTNPSVDLLAACLGLTLWLNKAGKHATAVFSGEVPNTLEFLQPEATLEKNTDSLRDFIISLDKSKADKLRYKVEDRVVKIFITPYRTSLSADDLEYSQGDFNVDTVIALGVSAQADLDAAITAHGRILHDATVATVTTGEEASELGSISWHDTQTSSISELMVDLGNALGRDQLDAQIATALLTGIVAETERFSNEKTTPQTMSASAELMAAGANQQLVASKLEEAAPKPEATIAEGEGAQAPTAGSQDGTLEITHPNSTDEPGQDFELPAPAPSEGEEPLGDDNSPPVPEPAEPEITDVKATGNDNQPTAEEGSADEVTGSRRMVEPPEHGGTLTANAQPEDVTTEPAVDPLSPPADGHLLDHDTPGESNDETHNAEESAMPLPEPAPGQMTPPPPSWMPPQPWMQQTPVAQEPAPAESQNSESTPRETESTEPAGQTLEEIEKEVNSPHLQVDNNSEDEDLSVTPSLDSARDEVMKAINAVPPANPEPIEALNAQPVDLSGAAAAEPQYGEPASTPDANATQPQASSLAFDPTAFEVLNDPEIAAMKTAQENANVQLPSLPGSPEQPQVPAPELTGPVEQPFTMPLPNTLTPPPANPVPPTSAAEGATPPPPVPPPLPFTPGPPRQ